MSCAADISVKLITKALQPTLLKIERALQGIGPKMKAEGERIARQKSRQPSGPQLSRPANRQQAIQQAMSVHQAGLAEYVKEHPESELARFQGAAATPTRANAKQLSDSDFPTVEVVVCVSDMLASALFGAAVVKG